MPESLLEFGRDIVNCHRNKTEPHSARYELLCKRPPRLSNLQLPMTGETRDVAIQLAGDLDHSVLPIQGPPGTGKTNIGSHMIAALSKQGKRIGVTAVSHKVILNLLENVHEHSNGTVPLSHKGSKTTEFPSFIASVKNKHEALEALNDNIVVGGTAWLWSSRTLEQQLDYLFVDEAGQMSLAMTIAAGRAAKNIVLLGDPQQLEQPQQGTHPGGAGVAALSHILEGLETIPPDKGMFLQNTWRLHPKICKFNSELYYDDRLNSQPGLELQTILGSSNYTGNGLRYVSVHHKGNQNRSEEEVQAIVGIIEILADGNHKWTKMDGTSHEITLVNILIVAPYNAQVSALRAAMPDAKIGTVDLFQGQEAPIVIYSMTSSSATDAPRGMGFLYSPNRMNVAISRARCLAILVGSPALFTPQCKTPDQLRLANGFCRYLELAEE